MLSNDTPWATIGLWSLTLIVALVGGAVVIWGNSLTFKDYVETLGAFAVAHGLLGIGRGYAAGQKAQAKALHESVHYGDGKTHGH